MVRPPPSGSHPVFRIIAEGLVNRITDLILVFLEEGDVVPVEDIGHHAEADGPEPALRHSKDA